MGGGVSQTNIHVKRYTDSRLYECFSYFLMLKHLVIIGVEKEILLYLVFIKNKYTLDSL